MAGLDFRLTNVYLRALGAAWLPVGDVTTAMRPVNLAAICSSVVEIVSEG